MATLQDCIDDMAAESTEIGVVSAFIAGLQAQIAAIPGITPAVQAQIDAVFAAAEANKTALAAAMVPAVVSPPLSTATAAGIDIVGILNDCQLRCAEITATITMLKTDVLTPAGTEASNITTLNTQLTALN